jgi:PAS domain S-box-containing protein
MSDRLRLFLIEDREDIALLIRHALERAEHEVVCCRSAADALIVLGQTSFDLVILDYLLEDMNGVQLIERLHADGVFIPILMITAHGDEHLATRVLQAGALDYVVKDAGLQFLEALPKRVAESVRRHQLEQMNQLLIQSLESTRDGVIVTDRQGIIIKVNQAIEKRSGYQREELLGRSTRIFQSGRHPTDFYRKLWATVSAGHSWQGEIQNRHKNGSVYTDSLTISPLVDARQRVTHYVAIYRDMTQHKQLEQQLLQAQKMQSIGTLAGGVAHEFNNLLAGINGYASLGLREQEVPPTLHEFFRNIVELSERAATLTRQLLAFARKPALSRQPTSLDEVLRSTVELIRRSMRHPVEYDPPQGDAAEFIVEADANQLQQALVNLGINARDALLIRPEPLPAGESGLRFTLHRESLTEPREGFPQPIPAGEYVVASVIDRGVGMKQDVLSQALDPFYTTKDVGQGTGLGLPMVFGIVQGHQGFLRLQSEAGQGTIAQLYLSPWSGIVEQSATMEAAPNSLLEPERQHSMNIIVIDDEQALLDVVRRFLEIAGHRIESYTSVEKFLGHKPGTIVPDLIILDLMIPREDPAGNFRLLRERFARVPILLCTGRAEPNPAPELALEASTTLLRKPFHMKELWRAVREATAPRIVFTSETTDTLF